MNNHRYIACDLGAESGRVIVGNLNEGKVSLEEVHRFPNGPVRVHGSLRWDVLRLFDEMKTGLHKVARSTNGAESGVAGLSVDSWGVDYVLVTEDEPMLLAPYHYRDARTDKVFETAMQNVSPAEIFGETGIQFMAINTLYQLIAQQQQTPHLLATADRFLLIADYFHYLFSGVPRVEESNASTTQLFNPATGRWSDALIEKFNLPAKVFPELVSSGTVLGPLLPAVSDETGLGEVPVIATCSHDTGAAVAAVPATGENWAYLSSGTWSLLGVELPSPRINDQVREANFTNEVGYGRTIRFLKNITGLWIVQECRRTWQQEGQQFDYDQLTRMATEAEPFRSLIDPADARFIKAGEMPRKIADFCRETGQPIPETPGQTVRCVLESLALLYRQTLEQLQQLTGRDIHRLHVVGGGSRNDLLNQFTANATGISVLVGPVEATAIGNLLIQALALGHLSGLDELRHTVRASFPITQFEPEATALWQDAYHRFHQLEAALR